MLGLLKSIGSIFDFAVDLIVGFFNALIAFFQAITSVLDNIAGVNSVLPNFVVGFLTVLIAVSLAKIFINRE